MRQVIAILLATLALVARAQAAPAPKAAATPALTKTQREKAERMKASAPADEYFGKMKLSFLGIDNTFRDQSVRAGSHTIDPGVINKLDFAADALRDWQHKYPKDPQLARSMWFGSEAYLKIWNAAGQNQAAYYLTTLRNHFPTTYFGKQAKATLTRGFTMHVYAAAQPCILLPNTVVPTPAPVPTPSKQNNIKVSVEPQPCYAVTPGPSGVPVSPPATPKATPAPRPSPSPSQSGPSEPTPAGSASPTQHKLR
jgi:hypothetical protein